MQGASEADCILEGHMTLWLQSLWVTGLKWKLDLPWDVDTVWETLRIIKP